MAALSALVFSLSWWLGCILWPVAAQAGALAFSAIGLCSFATAVALDGARLVTHSALLGHVEIYLVAASGWSPALRACRAGRALRQRAGTHRRAVAGRRPRCIGPAQRWPAASMSVAVGHAAMCVVISASTLGAMVAALRRRVQRIPVVGRAIITGDDVFRAGRRHPEPIPRPWCPAGWRWRRRVAPGLGVAVALWDAFDEGQALRADMLRRWPPARAVALLGGQMLIGIALTRQQSTAQTALTVLLFTSLAIAASVQVLLTACRAAGPAGVLAIAVAARPSGDVRRRTQSALPLVSADPLDDFDDDTSLGDPPCAGTTATCPSGCHGRPRCRPSTSGSAVRGPGSAAGAGHRTEGSATASPHSNRATAVTSSRARSRRYYTCTSVRGAAPNPRDKRRATAAGLDATARQARQWFVMAGRSGCCITGRTPRPGSLPPICAAGGRLQLASPVTMRGPAVG